MKKKSVIIFLISILTLAMLLVAFSACTKVGNKGLEFTINPDGESYSVTGFHTISNGRQKLNIVIPSTFNGLPVTKIEDDRVFAGYKREITSIIIPDSIISIGDGVFSGCSNLTDITIPNSVTSIGDGAFKDCIRLTSITIPDGVTSISDYTFLRCTSLTSITIPDSVTSIGDRAFEGCESLTSIMIPDSVTSIGSSTFLCCRSLTIYCEAANKPSEWKSYWNSSELPVVWNCNNNDVADDGYIYAVVDGIRYGIKNGVATVVKQPQNITVANITESISYNGVSYSVTSIGDRAFVGCSRLASVTIPSSVTIIGRLAFGGCTSLTDIYYAGTEKAWTKIASNRSDSEYIDGKIHYNYIPEG